MRQNKWVLFFLVVLFIAPGICAYLAYMNPTWLSGATTNKGHFISPPKQLHVFGDKKAYRLVLWYQQGCDEVCMAQLDKMARVRLALGRRYYDVSTWLIQGEEAPLLSTLARERLMKASIQVHRLNASEQKKSTFLSKTPALYLVDRKGYFILSYKPTYLPDELFHDIKQLLTMDKASN